MSEQTKKCTKCGERYPATSDFFYKNKLCKHGIVNTCKKCDNYKSKKWRDENTIRNNELKKNWAKNNQDKVKEINKKYFIANHDKIKKRQENWKSKNPEKIKKWEQNSPKARTRSKKNRDNNMENISDTYCKIIMVKKSDVCFSNLKKYPQLIELQRNIIKKYRSNPNEQEKTELQLEQKILNTYLLELKYKTQHEKN